MRYLARFFLFFLISISAFAQQTTDQQTCSVGKEETVSSVLEYDIVSLQIELYVLSTVQFEKPEDVVNLQKIASGAVFSLANVFSAYGDRFQGCSLSDDEYYQKIRQANTMSLLLNEIYGFKSWVQAVLLAEHWPLENIPPLLLAEHWPLENIPPLVGHLANNLAIRGHQLPMHPVIEDTLRAYARQWQPVDVTDPVQVAALELLGQKQNWDVKRFKLISFFRLLQGSAIFDEQEFFGESSEEFRARPISERLAIVAYRYLLP